MLPIEPVDETIPMLPDTPEGAAIRNAFLADERTFERYHEARAWERRHLDELLTY